MKDESNSMDESATSGGDDSSSSKKIVCTILGVQQNEDLMVPLAV